jgi:hypothetical protein
MPKIVFDERGSRKRFFLKKKQKLLSGCRRPVRDSRVDFFGSFFKKELFPVFAKYKPRHRDLPKRHAKIAVSPILACRAGRDHQRDQMFFLRVRKARAGC